MTFQSLDSKPSVSGRTGRIYLFLLPIFMLWISSQAALAQVAKAQISSPTLRIDAYARYSIQVQGAAPAERPVLNMPEPIQIVAGSEGTQRQLSVVNGIRNESIVFTWTITVDREGEFTIPPQEVKVQGDKTLVTNEVKIKISQDASNEDPRHTPIFQLELGKVRFYEGEQIPVTAKLLTHRMIQLRRLNLVEIPKDNLAIQRFPLQAGEELTELGGETYIERRFTSHLSALKSGSFEIGPATMEITMDVPLQDPNFRGRSFFMPSETRQFNAKSNTVKVNVLPLPKEGRPKNFSGLVGNFQMSATATPTKVQVGEPISVEITIEGEGNFDAIPAPTLSEAEGWKTYPAKKYQLDRVNDVSEPIQKLGFTQVLIPSKPTKHVPPFELSFFDPEKESYVTIRTEPLEVEITGTVAQGSSGNASSTSSAIQNQNQLSQEPPAAPVPRSQITDILEIEPSTLREPLERKVPVLRSKTFLMIHVAGFTVFALLALVKGLTVMTAPSVSAKERERLALRKRILTCKKDRKAFYQAVLEYMKYTENQAADVVALRDHAYAELYKNSTSVPQSPLSSKERESAIKILNL